MPQYYQYKDEKPIYRTKTTGPKGVTSLSDPFKGEAQFEKAGGTPYWKPDFKGVSNVELLDRPGTPSKDPVFRYTKGSSKVDEYYAGLDITPPTTEEIGQTRTDIIAQNQAQIDAIMQQYSLDIAAEAPLAAGRVGQTRAMAAAGGRLGSPMGQAQKAGTEAYNRQIMESIAAKKDIQIASIWTKIDERVDKRIEAERQEALGNAEAYIQFLEKGQVEAKADIVNLAKAGVDYGLLSDEDKEEMMKQTGLSDFSTWALWNANKPAPTKFTPYWQGSNLIMVDPTGQEEPRIYTAEEMGIPVGINVAFITDEVSGQSYWYDKDNPEMDEEGNLVMKSLGKFQESVAEEEARLRRRKEGDEDETKVKLSSSNRNLLLGAGFTNDIIDEIQSDLTASNSLDDIIAGLSGASKDQIITLTNVFTGVTATQARKKAEDVIRPDQIRNIAEQAINKLGDEAISSIEKAPTISGKTLTETIRQSIIAEIKAIQSEKRTFWQKILPFGK